MGKHHDTTIQDGWKQKVEDFKMRDSNNLRVFSTKELMDLVGSSCSKQYNHLLGQDIPRSVRKH